MKERKQRSPLKHDILNASEIGQYTYCSVSWYLQRCGYEPDSPWLETGKTLHKELGKTLDAVQENVRRSLIYALLGILLLIIACIILLYEVVL